jgi:hypothetical protein
VKIRVEKDDLRGGNIVENGKERPSIFSFNCPQCKREIHIAHVFGTRTHKGIRYEAWAKLWFEKNEVGGAEVGRNGKIIYEGKEYAPSTAAKIAVGDDKYEVDGWTEFWKYEGEKGNMTLDKLAKIL